MFTLAQAGSREAHLAGTALWLWISFAIAALVALGAAWVVVARQRKALLGAGTKRQRKPIRDAWQEAGRRLQVDDGDEADERDEP
ncbi:MAG: hypothetical protein IT437_10765 [Phycisphaerales bacterium]|nr:hypothetical protein [Phycisphaerales bacterium]